jgi:hypothetical protein
MGVNIGGNRHPSVAHLLGDVDNIAAFLYFQKPNVCLRVCNVTPSSSVLFLSVFFGFMRMTHPPCLNPASRTPRQ